MTKFLRRVLILPVALSALLSGALTYLFVSDNLGADYVKSTVENGTKSETADLVQVAITFVSMFIPAFLILCLVMIVVTRFIFGSRR